MDCSLWIPHRSLHLCFACLSCELWGQRYTRCACPAQRTAWTLDYLHTNKLPHIFPTSARAECNLQHIITMLEAKDTSLRPLCLSKPFLCQGEDLLWELPALGAIPVAPYPYWVRFGIRSLCLATHPESRQICRVMGANKPTWLVVTFQDKASSL